VRDEAVGVFVELDHGARLALSEHRHDRHTRPEGPGPVGDHHHQRRTLASALEEAHFVAGGGEPDQHRRVVVGR